MAAKSIAASIINCRRILCMFFVVVAVVVVVALVDSRRVNWEIFN